MGSELSFFSFLILLTRSGSPPWSTGRVGSFTFASPTPILRSSRSASRRLVAVKGSKVWRIDSRTNDYRLCYCEDPFGNIIEIYTHNYETLYGGMKAGKAQDEVGGNP